VVESTATAAGPTPPVANGDPLMGPSAPEPASMAKPETLLEPLFATYSSAPWGSIASPAGSAPATKGEPLMGLIAPPLWMANHSTALWAGSVTYRNFPECATASAVGVAPAPAENGEPGA